MHKYTRFESKMSLCSEVIVFEVNSIFGGIFTKNNPLVAHRYIFGGGKFFFLTFSTPLQVNFNG